VVKNKVHKDHKVKNSILSSIVVNSHKQCPEKISLFKLRSIYTERDRGLTAFAKEWSK